MMGTSYRLHLSLVVTILYYFWCLVLITGDYELTLGIAPQVASRSISAAQKKKNKKIYNIFKYLPTSALFII